jgi:hypothetical protein
MWENKVFTVCGGDDCCTRVTVHKTKVVLNGRGKKTRGRIEMPLQEFLKLQKLNVE